MTDDDVYELLETVYEMNTKEELEDEPAMMKDLRYFFGYSDPILKEIIMAARVMKALRGHRLPVWAQYHQNH